MYETAVGAAVSAELAQHHSVSPWSPSFNAMTNKY